MWRRIGQIFPAGRCGEGGGPAALDKGKVSRCSGCRCLTSGNRGRVEGQRGGARWRSKVEEQGGGARWRS